MTKRLKSPRQYIQGAGILQQLDTYLQGVGTHAMVLLSPGGIQRTKPTLDTCFANKNFTLDYVPFTGECTAAKIHALAQQCKDTHVSVVIGIGGGKILDTAKGVAHFAQLPMVIVPTVCSSDSPCSSLSVMYHDDGVFDAYLFLANCPDMVLVDTDVIVSSPVKFLVAGMGDALATWFEARACQASGHNNQVGALPTVAATQLAKTCWDVLQAHGRTAKKDAAQGLCSPAVARIIEVNTYLSSVGFESGGLAAAHAIQKGFTVIPELHHVQHGEKVAFCTLTQLVLEQAPPEELEAVMAFCHDVGLPITFAQMGYTAVDEATLLQAAQKACAPGSTIENLPFAVTPEQVAQALLTTDTLGTAFASGEPCTQGHL